MKIELSTTINLTKILFTLLKESSTSTMQNTLIKFAIALLAAAACAISGWLTVELVTSLQAGTLATACGLTFHGMQYGLAAAARSLQGNPVTKAATWLIATLFLALSITASVSFLESGYRSNQQQTTTAERSTHRLQALDQAIATRSDIASQYQRIDHLRSSAAQLDKLEHTISQAQTLDIQLATQPQPQFPAMLKLLASSLQLPETGTRLALFILIGSLLDLSGLLTLFYLFQAPQPAATRSFSGVATPETLQHSLVSERERLKQRITNGEFGPKPIQADIAKATGISKATVSRAFKELLTEAQAA